MPVMAKSEPKDSPPPQRTGKALNTTIRTDLMEMLEAFIDASRPKVTKTAVIETALEDFFERYGKPKD